jgi:hypothetical protein
MSILFILSFHDEAAARAMLEERLAVRPGLPRLQWHQSRHLREGPSGRPLSLRSDAPADFGQVDVHGLNADFGQNHRDAGAAGRANGTKLATRGAPILDGRRQPSFRWHEPDDARVSSPDL